MKAWLIALIVVFSLLIVGLSIWAVTLFAGGGGSSSPPAPSSNGYVPPPPAPSYVPSPPAPSYVPSSPAPSGGGCPNGDAVWNGKYGDKSNCKYATTQILNDINDNGDPVCCTTRPKQFCCMYDTSGTISSSGSCSGCLNMSTAPGDDTQKGCLYGAGNQNGWCASQTANYVTAKSAAGG